MDSSQGLSATVAVGKEPVAPAENISGGDSPRNVADRRSTLNGANARTASNVEQSAATAISCAAPRAASRDTFDDLDTDVVEDVVEVVLPRGDEAAPRDRSDDAGHRDTDTPGGRLAGKRPEPNPYTPDDGDEDDNLMVDVRNLWVRYGRVAAVRGIDLQIPKGEVFGFIGPNGAGKSTTIKVLATLRRQFQAERVDIKGMSIRHRTLEVRECIGYVPDFFGVYEELTVREYLHFFAAAYRLPTRQRAGVVDDVLELTDLTGKIDSPVDGLSRGMKQRLSVARVLLHDPDLLLLDEPASGLDPRARIEMRELLKALKEMGKTILISSHILHELSHLCTQVGIIEAGQIVAGGSLKEIFQQLGLQRAVHMQISNITEGMLNEIRALSGVAGVEHQVDRLVIHLHEDRRSVEDLLDAVYQMGARIRMFQPETIDMETAFMRLTEGKTA